MLSNKYCLMSSICYLKQKTRLSYLQNNAILWSLVENSNRVCDESLWRTFRGRSFSHPATHYGAFFQKMEFFAPFFQNPFGFLFYDIAITLLKALFIIEFEIFSVPLILIFLEQGPMQGSMQKCTRVGGRGQAKD